ncbi:MAG: flagellar motor switch protein FliG [Pseudomonadales bacterium]|nr:flagellar motor switch protein FliG [Pseudomonadales bacterium]
MSEAALELPTVDQAAILLLTIGESEAANVLKHLDQREVQRLSEAMSGLASVSTDQIEMIVDGFLETVSDESGLTMGAGKYIKNTLTNALGESKANSVIEKINGGSTAGLDRLRWMDPRAVAEFIMSEHPQVQAIVMSFLEADQAARVLDYIDDTSLRRDIVMRVANLDAISPAAISELADVIEHQTASSAGPVRFAQLGGKRSAAEIMNNMSKEANEPVMEAIKEIDQGLGDAINELMFVFDNLLMVDDRGIQTLLKEISTDSLTMALKGADPALQNKVFGNMSSRAADLLKDDMDAKGPVRLSEVEGAQKEILLIARRLADEGEIMLGGSGGDEMV